MVVVVVEAAASNMDEVDGVEEISGWYPEVTVRQLVVGVMDVVEGGVEWQETSGGGEAGIVLVTGGEVMEVVVVSDVTSVTASGVVTVAMVPFDGVAEDWGAPGATTMILPKLIKEDTHVVTLKHLVHNYALKHVDIQTVQ